MNNLTALGLVALAFGINCSPLHGDDIQPVRNDYQVAEHFGCSEVRRVCVARKRMEWVQNGRKYVAGR